MKCVHTYMFEWIIARTVLLTFINNKTTCVCDVLRNVYRFVYCIYTTTSKAHNCSHIFSYLFWTENKAKHNFVTGINFYFYVVYYRRWRLFIYWFQKPLPLLYLFIYWHKQTDGLTDWMNWFLFFLHRQQYLIVVYSHLFVTHCCSINFFCHFHQCHRVVWTIAHMYLYWNTIIYSYTHTPCVDKK